MPAARRQATPSRIAEEAALACAAGSSAAWAALARFMSSLEYFHRVMSGTVSELNVDARSATATVCATSSTPEGWRPTSRMPLTGWDVA